MTTPSLLIALLVAGVGFAISSYRRARASALPPKSDPPVMSDPIGAFWSWRATARGPLGEKINRHESYDEYVDALSAHIGAIDPDLQWELGPGVKSDHHLCVTGAGDSKLRVTAERWRSRAPAPDALWEYYPARQRGVSDPAVALKIDGVELTYGDLRFELSVDETRRRVNARVFHPKFEELPEGNRNMALFLMLDNLLGEDGVERWVGEIDRAADATDVMLHSGALTEAVDRLSGLDADSFIFLEASKDGKPLLAVVNVGLRRLDHLLMDSHIEVTISYETEREDGMCTGPTLEDLNAVEEDLIDALGPEAVDIGHETGLGRRVIHLHAAANGPASRIIEQWERSHPSWEIETVARDDPQWRILQRF